MAVTLVTGLVAAAGAASGAAEPNRPIPSPIASGAPQASQGLPSFDSRERDPSVRVDGTTEAARGRLLATIPGQAVLDSDPATGAIRSLGRLDGLLTGPSSERPPRIALDYVRARHAAFGIARAQVDSLRLQNHFTDPDGNHHLWFTQEVDGVPVFGAGLKANLTADGRLINIVNGPAPDVSTRTTTPAVPAAQAVRVGLRNGDAERTDPGEVRSSARGPDELTTFGRGNRASLVIFPTASGGRLGWQVNANATSTGSYIDVVDAASAKVLYRQNTVEFATGLAWRYYPSNLVPAGVGSQAAVAFPVDGSGFLSGNNAHTYADVNDTISVPGGSVPPSAEIPPSGGGAWNYAASLTTDDPLNSCDPRWACTWDAFTANSWQANQRQNATQVYYYVNNFHDYLKSDPDIGFNEAAGNFQVSNGGLGGLGGDAVQAQVDDGANTDSGFPDAEHQVNANMSTQQDGIPPRMQMYLFPADTFSLGAPSANGGDDASVIYHEYTHGLSNRLVTQPNGVPGLNAFQSSSMGEAWSDWYAMDYLINQGYDADTATVGDVQVGFFINGGTGIRTEPMDCPANGTDSGGACPGGDSTGVGGYTLGDMGKIIGEPEVHADGEIWGQTLWQIRQALGANVTQRLVTQGMQLSPASPSMLDMRNAILQADLASFGGAHVNTLWTNFAQRGMGYFAADQGANDTAPIESLSTPPGCASGCGTLSGRVLDGDTLKPVGNTTVRIKGAPGLAATTNAAGNYAITNVPPHTYPYLTVSRSSYTSLNRQSVAINAGTNTLNFTIRRDWADVNTGAQVTSFSPPDYSASGCGPDGGFDNSLESGWGSTSVNPQDPSNPGGVKSAIVRLPKAIDLRAIAVDPGATCGDDDHASAKSLRIETSSDGVQFSTVASPIFSAAQNHKLNNVPLTKTPTRVRVLRVRMQSNQDPFSGGSGRNFMDLSEVALYGKPSDVTKPVISKATITTGQSVRSVISRGFKMSAHLSEAGTMTGALLITAQKARQFGIQRQIGTGTLTFTRAATQQMTMNLTTAAKNRLKDESRLAVTATLNATDKVGNEANPVSKATTLPH